MPNTTRAALIIQTIAQRIDDDAAIDNAAVGMFTADMAARLAAKRREGRHGWWDPDTCGVQTLARMLRNFVEQGELLDAANLAMFLYCRDGGEDAARQIMSAPDPRASRVAEEMETYLYSLDDLGLRVDEATVKGWVARLREIAK